MSNSQNTSTRRNFLISGAALATTTACGNGVSSGGASRIDTRVSQTVQHMYAQYPGTRDLAQKAVGMLVMPLITEAGFGIGGSFGRGALQINGATVDYYSAASGSFGLQIGAKQFAHVLFFMTNESLYDFRNSHGWAAGADLEYAVSDQGGDISTDTTTVLSPVIAVIFGQAGLHIGASLEGTKYTRIIP
ncbi:YSC84-related protein [Thalassobius sp. I31.1]|uniref:lipid-binding SYLF domain-containing protein n=1 Tax=Thalassobius sp. I31.1 TaxID=2109912 RepID=UPI000D19C2B2|nr:YSC84-related protein [Thalassobius sp. I31.1]